VSLPQRRRRPYQIARGRSAEAPPVSGPRRALRLIAGDPTSLAEALAFVQARSRRRVAGHPSRTSRYPGIGAPGTQVVSVSPATATEERGSTRGRTIDTTWPRPRRAAVRRPSVMATPLISGG